MDEGMRPYPLAGSPSKNRLRLTPGSAAAVRGKVIGGAAYAEHWIGLK